uniref:Uncharacterized protein n=1 Tax=Rhizophora mucronata TaxID=61149 RepID=A0A2P2P7D4_RHIMU
MCCFTKQPEKAPFGRTIRTQRLSLIIFVKNLGVSLSKAKG